MSNFQLRENQNLQVVILEKIAKTERSSCAITLRKQLKENDKIRKKQMRDNLDNNKKGEFKKFSNKRKKEKRDKRWYSWKGIIKKL